jgi:gas vesicle protein
MSSGNDHGYRGSHILIAFLAGAAAGAAVAFLTAPQSGKETREKVRDWAQDVKEKAARVPGMVQGAYGRAADAAKRAFTEKIKEDIADTDA